jgi:CRISPR-associated protein Cmr6
MLPLYKEAKLAGNLNADAHRGLWWSRFFNQFGANGTAPEVGGKGEFIKEICKTQCGESDTLTANALRQAGLFAALEGIHSCYQTQGRFATGMGNDHPTENGFTWHPTLGVPYLPASSVKGLVRGWLEWQWGADALKKNGDADKRLQLLRWFGSEHKEPREQQAEHQAGWFIFFDALPVAPVSLAADVMTPHYDKWYENGGNEQENTQSDTVPADWHSPVPVTFLTVKKATFQFGIAVRQGLKQEDKSVAQNLLPEVMAVLQDALEWAGAGAKTATGYGRMGVDEKAQKEIARLRTEAMSEQQEQQRLMSLGALSPSLRLIEELRVEIEKRVPKGKVAISDAFWGGRIKKFSLEVEQSKEWRAEEKRVLADMLEEWVVKVIKLEPKEIRKQLKLTALRGQI